MAANLMAIVSELASIKQLDKSKVAEIIRDGLFM